MERYICLQTLITHASTTGAQPYMLSELIGGSEFKYFYNGSAGIFDTGQGGMGM
jgi:hypothetical protein